MPYRTLAGSRGIVTGASSGIGRAIALELVRHGARVLVVARREDRLVELQTQIRADGGATGELRYLAGNICDVVARQQMLAVAESAWGGLDFLVNAAGISATGRFAESTPERLRQILEVNFFAPAELIRTALPLLQQGNRPLVVNVGSILAHRGIPWHAEYCASKFALQGLSESIRPELGRLGVDLLIISPGTTKTELYAQDAGRQALPWRQPAGVPAEYVARKTVQAMARGRREIIPNWQGRALVYLSRWCPWLIDRLMARYG